MITFPSQIPALYDACWDFPEQCTEEVIEIHVDIPCISGVQVSENLAVFSPRGCVWNGDTKYPVMRVRDSSPNWRRIRGIGLQYYLLSGVHARFGELGFVGLMFITWIVSFYIYPPSLRNAAVVAPAARDHDVRFMPVLFRYDYDNVLDELEDYHKRKRHPRPLPVAVHAEEGSLAECAVCYDNVPNQVLLPCEHAFCQVCGYKFKECPACRTLIEKRQNFKQPRTF